MALTAPAESQKTLLSVAEKDLAIARNHATIRGLAQALSIQTLEKALEDIRARRHDAMVERDGVQSELSRAESDVSLVDARIAKDSERLSQTSSAKDAQGLEHELESLAARKSDLEDIELAIMERLEEASAALASLEEQLASAEGALSEARAQEKAQSAEIAATTSQLTKEREVLVASVPADLVELYERQRERYGIGASHLRAGISSASGVALTESDLQKIRETPEDTVVLCPDSNAILVRTAESGL
jgi:predicted  nucleic acid-binding Zn-ribbon protein